MPLLDHFHAPLSRTYSWGSFHGRWANSIGDALDALLPRRYFSEIQTHHGTQIEADVAECERTAADPEEASVNGPTGSVAVQPWAPPVATTVFPAEFPDDLEVQVYDTLEGARLVGVIELISPCNKDRATSRRAFAAKCAAYLQRGIGVVTVDIVTNRHGNMHNELIRLLELPETYNLGINVLLYAVAYRPMVRDGRNEIDVWTTTLTVGGLAAGAAARAPRRSCRAGRSGHNIQRCSAEESVLGQAFSSW